jgi:hypothetical protein
MPISNSSLSGIDTEKSQAMPSDLGQRRLPFTSLGVFVLIFGVCIGHFLTRWPLLFNFVVFGFRDHGSFLTLEELLAKHLRLGVDVGYTYGLIPVLLQHVLVWMGGRGPELILGIIVAYLLITAILWTFLWRTLGSSWELLVGILVLSPFFIMTLPTPAHAMLQLTLMFGLLFILMDKLPAALVVAAFGCLCMPSLPIAEAGLLCVLILFAWWNQPQPRRAAELFRKFLPAVAVYVGFGLILSAWFGWDSFYASILPTAGAALYKASNFGVFKAGSLWLHPPGARITYYLGTVVGWWLAGTLLLTIFALRAAAKAWSDRRISPLQAFTMFCCILHFVFIFAAFGNGHHSMYYDSIIVAGVLAGLSAESNTLLRRATLAMFMLLSVVGQWTSTRALLEDWKTLRKDAATGFLYATPGFTAEWKPILEASSHQNVMILAYGNGVREFFPQVHTPDSWFLLPGLLKPAEKQKLLEQIRSADMVAEEFGPMTDFIDQDDEIQAALKGFPVPQKGQYFRVWRK